MILFALGQGELKHAIFGKPVSLFRHQRFRSDAVDLRKIAVQHDALATDDVNMILDSPDCDGNRGLHLSFH